jgi:hypothetical protein
MLVLGEPIFGHEFDPQDQPEPTLDGDATTVVLFSGERVRRRGSPRCSWCSPTKRRQRHDGASRRRSRCIAPTPARAITAPCPSPSPRSSSWPHAARSPRSSSPLNNQTTTRTGSTTRIRLMKGESRCARTLRQHLDPDHAAHPTGDAERNHANAHGYDPVRSTSQTISRSPCGRALRRRASGSVIADTSPSQTAIPPRCSPRWHAKRSRHTASPAS